MPKHEFTVREEMRPGPGPPTEWRVTCLDCDYEDKTWTEEGATQLGALHQRQPHIIR